MKFSLISRGATFFIIFASTHILLMAAVANDETGGEELLLKTSNEMLSSNLKEVSELSSKVELPMKMMKSNKEGLGKMKEGLMMINVKESNQSKLNETWPPDKKNKTNFFFKQEFKDIKVVQSLLLQDKKQSIDVHTNLDKAYEASKELKSYKEDGEVIATSWTTHQENKIVSLSPFVSLNSTIIKAQFKSTALLPCHVRASGDGVTVSWIRRKDYHLLTVGLQTYSSDDRFQAIHEHTSQDWTLKIKYVQPRDGGLYECQVSTHPPSSIFVTLDVYEARASISGGPDKYIKSGSRLELNCEIFDSTQEPEYIFWYQGLRMINYDKRMNVTNLKSSSILILSSIQRNDSGNYTCVPSNAHPASIFVHILNGENPAAMQHGSHSTSCVPCPPLWLLSFIVSCTLQVIYIRCLFHNINDECIDVKGNVNVDEGSSSKVRTGLTCIENNSTCCNNVCVTNVTCTQFTTVQKEYNYYSWVDIYKYLVRLFTLFDSKSKQRY